MSALSFRLYNRHSQIVSIEPNPCHEPDLRFVGLMMRGFRYEMIAAGATDAELDLCVPVYRACR